MSLAQKTDLKSRKTVKEIVDGQQRSQAIFDFFNGDLRLTSKSVFSGKRYANLDEEQKQTFLEYALSVDLFVGATPEDIRQVFRRINSYTVPLNPQEQRHATYQGDFKWFIVELTSRHAQNLIDIGVFKEKQISRVNDAQFFTEVTMSLIDGLASYSKRKIDQTYAKFDDHFPLEDTLLKEFSVAMSDIIAMPAIHSTNLMKPPAFLTLLVAVLHLRNRYAALNVIHDFGRKTTLKTRETESGLSQLAEALVSDSPKRKCASFVEANQENTNSRKNRSIRFEWFCKAMNNERI